MPSWARSLAIVAALSLLCLGAARGSWAQPGPISCQLTATTTFDTQVPPNSVQYTASIDGGTGFYTWHLDFGDQTSAAGMGTSASAFHTYSKTGTYTATLSVSDDLNDRGSCSIDVTFAGQVTAKLAESVGLSDLAGNQNNTILHEGISMGETVSATGPRSLSDSISASDKAHSSLGNQLNESIGLSEQASSNSFSRTAQSTSSTSTNQVGGFPVGLLVGVGLVGVAAIGVAAYLMLRPRRSP